MAGYAGDGHEPAHALSDLVNAWSSGVGPVLTETRKRAVDDARVDCCDRGVVDTESMFDVGAHVLDDHVGSCRELHEQRKALGCLQIDRDGSFVAMQVLEVRIVFVVAG